MIDVAALVGIPVGVLALLVLASFAAGWIDSIVGGGGLIQLPALLIGLPSDTSVPMVSGTNKVPSAFGTAMAAVTYARSVAVSLRQVLPLIAGAAAGSGIGAQLTHLLAREQFTPIVLAAVVVVGVYTWRRPQLGLAAIDKHVGTAALWRLAAIGLAVGLWDGFIGPGTGSFFLIALVGVMGYEFLTATTLAKMANLTTNIAAIAVFAASGQIWWAVALPMAVANLTGGWLGSRTAVRNGNAFVRKVFLVVVAALAVKLAADIVQQWW
ncbi:sulfite exporter TauE/SafE family protein [Nigerium massiliense]|uniref:sulfite exporter TauE/SafE family protein n=1 Tax=Nigerium massiliense TaxID=1522317 RepID=UPI00058F247F|nr:TSUP family transporter [Nigerium massiliense]